MVPRPQIRWRSRGLALCLGLVLAATAALAGSDDSLVVRSVGDTYEVTVPVSRLKLTIPRGDLTQVEQSREGATASPRYFQFTDRRRGLVVSGWFEAEPGYKGLEALWAKDTAAWAERRAPTPEAATRLKVGDWEVMRYEVRLPAGFSTHLRAELARKGTWIDLHLSVTSMESLEATRTQVVEMLKSLRVTDRP